MIPTQDADIRIARAERCDKKDWSARQPPDERLGHEQDSATREVDECAEVLRLKIM